jgi:hypothetical protein
MSGPFLSALSADQLADLRYWATHGAVRLYDAGAISFEYLCDIQAFCFTGEEPV